MPSRTADGHAIVLSDPHSPIAEDPPFEFFVQTGDIHSANFGVTGAAFGILGHTERVAWGMTTGAPRVSDLYEVEVDRNDPRRYRMDDEWLEMVTEEATIEVLDEGPISRTFEYTTHNGVLCPVVARTGEKAYVVSTPYMTEGVSIDQQLLDWQRCTDIASFRDAMRPLGQFSQNVMAADRNGDAWYARAGRVPVRAEGVDPSAPVPGNTTATQWQGIHPIEDLVQISNPSCGYMHNCNTAPDTMIPDAAGTTLDALNHRPYLFNDTPGRTHSRTIRAEQLLSAATAATVDDAIDIALDDHWIYTDRWTSALRSAAASFEDRVDGWPDERKQLLDTVLSFHGTPAPESVPAMSYYMWRSALPWIDGLTEEQASTLRDTIDAAGSLDATQESLLLDALERAHSDLIDTHGRLDVAIGDVFRVGTGDTWFPSRSTTFLTHTKTPPNLGTTMVPQLVAMTVPLRVMMSDPRTRTTNGRHSWAGDGCGSPS